MRSQSIKIKVNGDEKELHIGDHIWFTSEEDYNDTVQGGVIEMFYNNSFKLKGENKYYSDCFITTLDFFEK